MWRAANAAATLCRFDRFSGPDITTCNIIAAGCSMTFRSQQRRKMGDRYGLPESSPAAAVVEAAALPLAMRANAALPATAAAAVARLQLACEWQGLARLAVADQACLWHCLTQHEDVRGVCQGGSASAAVARRIHPKSNIKMPMG